MSRKEPEIVTIGENDFYMTMMNPIMSEKLFRRVVGKVAPSLGAVLDVISNNLQALGSEDTVLDAVLDFEIPKDFFRDRFGDLLNAIDDVTMDTIQKEFIRVSQVKTDDMVSEIPLQKKFQEVFEGDIGALYQWLAWGCRVQWGKSLSAIFGAYVTQIKSRISAARTRKKAGESNDEASSLNSSTVSSGD